MDFFVGLTFYQNQFQFKKIDNFRRCFDPKAHKSKILHMSLLPPFKIDYRDFELFVDHVEEDIELQLHDLPQGLSIQFQALDFFDGEHGMVFLRPQIPDNLFHCMESIVENIKSFKGDFTKKRHRRDGHNFERQVVLPIGRFNNHLQLEEAMISASEQFTFPMSLEVKEIALFEKVPNHWPIRRRLFVFPKKKIEILDEDFDYMVPNEIIK